MVRRSLSGLLALALLVLLQSCNFTTAHVEKVVFARAVDGETKEPVDETRSFHGADAVLHCAVKMANTPSGTTIKARWYFIQEDTQEVIDTTEITLENDGWVDFNLTLTRNSLPYGNYAVDLFINGEFDQTVPFTIEPAFPDGLIKEAVTARELSEAYFPTQPTDVFPTGVAYVFAPVYVSGQPEGTVFAAQWYQHLEGGNREPISAFELPFDQEGWIGFSLNLPEGIPAGAYSVDLSVDGNIEHTLEFRAE